MINLEQLINWLGTEGATAGLVKSDLTIQEILDLCPDEKIGASKMKREELARLVVQRKRNQLTKRPEELVEMDPESLREYFATIKASKQELLEILSVLDIRPGSIGRQNLTDFAAREISEIGMYKRVAKGGDQQL